MATLVLQLPAAAGSNYWLDCGKWGQMQRIIREPVDSGSLPQWLVINKIIGERWQRFLEFFLICMPLCAEFFKTSFLMCEGWLSNDALSCSVTHSCRRFKLAGVTCTCMLQRPHVWDPHSFAAVRICMSECPASLFFLAAFYPARGASRIFLSGSECQSVWIHYGGFYSNECTDDFLTNTIRCIRKEDVYHSFSNYISLA